MKIGKFLILNGRQSASVGIRLKNSYKVCVKNENSCLVFFVQEPQRHSTDRMVWLNAASFAVATTEEHKHSHLQSPPQRSLTSHPAPHRTHSLHTAVYSVFHITDNEGRWNRKLLQGYNPLAVQFHRNKKRKSLCHESVIKLQGRRIIDYIKLIEDNLWDSLNHQSLVRSKFSILSSLWLKCAMKMKAYLIISDLSLFSLSLSLDGLDGYINYTHLWPRHSENPSNTYRL